MFPITPQTIPQNNPNVVATDEYGPFEGAWYATLRFCFGWLFRKDFMR